MAPCHKRQSHAECEEQELHCWKMRWGVHGLRKMRQVRTYKGRDMVPRLNTLKNAGATSVNDPESLSLGIDKFNPMPLERREKDLEPVDDDVVRCCWRGSSAMLT